ncbi:MAG: S1 RNA-binding domain-containing protein [Candidatus Moduliflexus flocculans]|nr:S1 RNA-binding domain-containing protein [Candidatus Moduliflexus flocculans]
MLEIDKEKGKISLGIKQRFTDPWSGIETKYPLGKRLIAKVVKIVSFGAFIELEDGVEGLLHISDLTWEGRPTSVEEYVAVGDKLWVQVDRDQQGRAQDQAGAEATGDRARRKNTWRSTSAARSSGPRSRRSSSRGCSWAWKTASKGVIKISDISFHHIESPGGIHEGRRRDRRHDHQRRAGPQLQGPAGHQAPGRERMANCSSAKHKPGSVIEVTVSSKIIDGGIIVEITQQHRGLHPQRRHRRGAGHPGRTWSRNSSPATRSRP